MSQTCHGHCLRQCSIESYPQCAPITLHTLPDRKHSRQTSCIPFGGPQTPSAETRCCAGPTSGGSVSGRRPMPQSAGWRCPGSTEWPTPAAGCKLHIRDASQRSPLMISGCTTTSRQRPARSNAPVGVPKADDGLLTLEVPHHGGAVGAARRQDVLHLLVPGQVGDLTTHSRPRRTTLRTFMREKPVQLTTAKDFRCPTQCCPVHLLLSAAATAPQVRSPHGAPWRSHPLNCNTPPLHRAPSRVSHLQRGVQRWSRGFRQVPNAQVAVCCARSEQVRTEAVELQALYSTGVLLHLSKLWYPVVLLRVGIEQDGWVPQAHRAVCETTSQETQLQQKTILSLDGALL